MACELCETPGGTLLWQDGRCRIVLVGDAEGAAFPGFCRVIWREHVAEMSALPGNDRHHLIDLVDATERIVRDLMHPDKINLASLGNVVPHLHWHVIPRWRDDSHFPAPVWTAARRPVPARPQADVRALAAAFSNTLGASQ